MDGRRFDDLTKALSTGTDRRRVLRGLAGIGAGSLGLFAAARTAGAQEPAADDDRCRRRCLRRCRRRGLGNCRDRCCDD